MRKICIIIASILINLYSASISAENKYLKELNLKGHVSSISQLYYKAAERTNYIRTGGLYNFQEDTCELGLYYIWNTNEYLGIRKLIFLNHYTKFDEQGRIISTSLYENEINEPSQTQYYTYDTLGNIIEINTNHETKEIYNYNDMYQLISIESYDYTNTIVYQQKFNYNSEGQLLDYKYGRNITEDSRDNVSYEYSSDSNYPWLVHHFENLWTTYFTESKYDYRGNPIETYFGLESVYYKKVKRDFDDNNNITIYASMYTDIENDTIQSCKFEYTYDTQGNWTKVVIYELNHHDGLYEVTIVGKRQIEYNQFNRKTVNNITPEVVHPISEDRETLISDSKDTEEITTKGEEDDENNIFSTISISEEEINNLQTKLYILTAILALCLLFACLKIYSIQYIILLIAAIFSYYNFDFTITKSILLDTHFSVINTIILVCVPICHIVLSILLIIKSFSSYSNFIKILVLPISVIIIGGVLPMVFGCLVAALMVLLLALIPIALISGAISKDEVGTFTDKAGNKYKVYKDK